MGIADPVISKIRPSASSARSSARNAAASIQFPMRGLAYGLNGGFYYSQLTVNF